MTSIPPAASAAMSNTAHQQHQGHTAPIASSSVAGKKTTSTLDALTSTLQSSRLAEKNSSAYMDIEPEAFKRLLVEGDQLENGDVKTEADAKQAEASSSSKLPQLRVLLHDRIWAHGGELVMQLGVPKAITQNGGESQVMPPPQSLENVDHVKVEFTAAELQQAITHIRQACSEADCEAVVLYENSGTAGEYASLMLRRIPSSAQELLELRIAVIGNVDAGKSSTLGVLTKGGLDDGRGKARVNLFRHKHEIESGRTSSVGMEIMGFDTRGEVVMNIDKKNIAEPGRKMSWEEVCEKSAKVISFIDLAGHERYLKTTVGGLTGCLPDFVMLMVGANAGLIGMSKEHLGVALALSLPVLVCITKVDMTPPHILEATIKQLTKILRSPGCRKTPIFVENQEQAVNAALRLGNERICPVFQISNVTGQNLNLLRSFLNILPQANQAKFSPDLPFKFQLQDVFSVPFVGCVVSGVILAGVVRIGDNLVIGPDSLGQFISTSVRSIQRKRVNVDSAIAGQSASFALKKIRRNQVRKGMVMMSTKSIDGSTSLAPPKAHLTCDAEILCLYHQSTLSQGSTMVLHAASIRQTVKILQIARLDGQGNIIPSASKGTDGAHNDDGTAKKNHQVSLKSDPGNVIRTADRALVRLQFIRYPEHIEPGLKLITREGRTKLIGRVVSVGQTADLSLSLPPKTEAAITAP